MIEAENEVAVIAQGVKFDDKYLRRFWSRVRKSESCWEWTGCTGSGGYGLIWMNGRARKTHRISYEIHYGTIPAGLCTCHQCDNPTCVKPTHLFLGTLSDNTRDMDKKGRRVPPLGEAQHLAKLKASDILQIRSMHATGNFSYRALGKLFGVGYTNIGHVVKRKTWAHIPSH